ncbi:hypothetical protein chiPu_0015709 [Chiloscyllium punctatum]|uniref:Uncharacterized protein n=1 Tax=Chiloscyllium punctatum TaxID=137246 RepID=A0A401T3K0_CHIPU|nr:hypothetical protein [Chiloscyllium punctatum]
MKKVLQAAPIRLSPFPLENPMMDVEMEDSSGRVLNPARDGGCWTLIGLRRVPRGSARSALDPSSLGDGKTNRVEERVRACLFTLSECRLCHSV